MYEEHFGLKSRPFGAKAEGAAVFAGPLQAKIMSNLTKGLAATDAVVTVTGPVGVGKTSIVSRALESISPGRMVAWVGRMQLAPDEVLELLLAGFGVNRQGRGTIQKFAVFRRLLAERAAAGAQVAIVVEDAHRIGADALVELEALTAADTGDSTSANIILMGQPNLKELLSRPELARMNQRVRLRQKIDALTEAEVAGYLRHCIRAAGGDYDAVFDSDAEKIVFACSQGIPRVINTMCETALAAAAQDGEPRISAALMGRIAADAFDYEAPPVPFVQQDSAEAPPPVPQPVPPANVMPDPATEAAEEIPALINDTQPALEEISAAQTQDAVLSAEAEETQTQKTLSVPLFDETPAESTDDTPFSLDEALAVDAGETNVMPGITPNLDKLAGQQKQTAAEAPVASPTTENIPTLSNSMRIDVSAGQEKAPRTDQQSLGHGADAQVASVTDTPQAPATDDAGLAEHNVPQTAPVPAPQLAPDTAVATPAPTAITPADNVATAAPPAAPQARDAWAGVDGDVDSVEPVAELSAEPAPLLADDVPPLAPDSAGRALSKAPALDQNAASTAAPGASDTASAAQAPPAAVERRLPDIDALEKALDAAKKGDFASDAEPPAAVPGPPADDADQLAGIPEITLDDALAKAPKKPAIDPELLKVAEQIGRASSLEDINDVMAETIFGSEALDEIAAAVVANPPDDVEESPVMLAESEIPMAANDAAENDPATPGNDAPASEMMTQSPAERLDMVKALNQSADPAPGNGAENIEFGTTGRPQPKVSGPQPEPIEQQINTSMTQTLQALNAGKARPANDEDEKKSGGLFSRFRKSS